MKTLIALLCVLAFASANFTPHWHDCGNSTATNVFTPTNVTVQNDPTDETKTFVSACGTVKSHGRDTIFHMLEVYPTESELIPIYMKFFLKVVPSGSTFCLNYTQMYSRGYDVLVGLTAYNILGDQVACVNLTLNWTDTNPEFLSKRKELVF